MESWVSLGGKEGCTNIQVSAEPGWNWGPCGWNAEILQTVPTMPALAFKYKHLSHATQFLLVQIS